MSLRIRAAFVPPRPPSPPTTADITRQYIEEHPSIRSALRDDLLNYTLLARKIQAERNLRNEEAVTIACRRYRNSSALPAEQLARARAIVRSSRLEVHSRVAIVRLRESWEILDRLLELGRDVVPEIPQRRLFEILQGTQAITVLCDETLLPRILPEIPARLVLTTEGSLATLALRSPPEVTETPGVLAYLAQELFLRGINCLETVSVHSESLFVFRDQDVIAAYQVLSALCAAEGPPPPVATASRGEQRRRRGGASATPR